MCVLITLGVETESQYCSFTTFFFLFKGCYLHILLHTLRERPFNLKGGYVLFVFLNILIPNVAEKNILILVEEKKII